MCTEPSIKGSGLQVRISEMAEEYKYGQMGVGMMDTGKMIKLMEEVGLCLHKGTCMLGNGQMIRCMVKVKIFGQMAHIIMANT